MNVLNQGQKCIDHQVNLNVHIPDVPLLRKSFSEKTLKYIYSLKDYIDQISKPERDFFYVILLGILNETSKAKKSGGFLRITNQRKVPPNAVKKRYLNAMKKFLADVKSISFKNVNAEAHLGDARKYTNFIKSRKYDAIFTSPPYPNRHDYTRIYQLELLLGFIDTNKSLKSLRYKTLRSHVEAKERFKAKNYKIPSILEKKIDHLGKRELNNKKIIPTLYGYFEDMYLSIKEMKNVIKKNKYIGLVVSNVRFSGILIPVDELLAEIGKQVGLENQNIYVLKYRGNSPQQMLKYDKVPTRESLIIWKS